MSERDTRRMLEAANDAATAGDFASAEELLTSVARIQEAELGPIHPDLANTLNNLAIVTEQTGRPSEAEALYRRAAAIASASLPADHPMVVDSRQNLEDFCRARGLSIDPPSAITAAPVTPLPDPLPATPTASQQLSLAPSEQPLAPRRASRPLAWVTIGLVVLVIGVFLVRSPWSSRETSTLPPAATSPAPRAAEPVPPAAPAPIEPIQPPKVVPRGDDRDVVADKPPASASLSTGLSVVSAELCQTFSTRGGSWQCEPADDSVAQGQIVLLTRVRSPRDATIVHRWYRGNTLRQSVKLTIRANATEGYRTYSRQTVDAGADWRIEVRSADGELLHEQRFAVR